MDEVQDHDRTNKVWTLFEDFFGRGPVQVPLISFPHPLHWLNKDLFPETFYLTKFMILDVVVAVLVAWAYIWLARRIRDGKLPKGRGANLLESLLFFVRDDIVKPVMGKQDTTILLPFVWTVFLFVLFGNLLGMVPFLGSPTASIWTTGALALLSFFLFHAVAITRIGLLNYLSTMWVPVQLGPGWIGYVIGSPISILLFGIEMLGTAIKATVLAIRLFANIFAGHVVLATILTFAYAASILTLPGIGIDLVTVLGAVALSLLELLVAFLQAYIFAFLTTLFIGLPLIHHAEHAGHGEEHGQAGGHGHEPGHAEKAAAH
jgi:F-type H+-transporting ATPase subunit a